MPSQNRVTLAEIAQRSNVSQATVSLVLRHKPGVGAATRQRVLDTAKELGYLSKNGVQDQSNLTNVGLVIKAEQVISPLENQFYSRVLAGIESVCRKWRVNLLYATMPVDQDSYPIETPRLITERATTDALLFIGALLTDTLLEIVQQHSTPIVLVDAYSASDVFDAVVSDNRKGAYRATTYLIENGHRHIGFVGCHPQAYPSIKERRQGYSQALQDHAITKEYVAECHIIDSTEIVRNAADLLRNNPAITALFCANDEVALAVVEAAKQLGAKIPQDLSLIGFDNIRSAEKLTPPLTTMHIDKFGMGRYAMQLLLNRVNYPESNPVTAVIHSRLIERSSVRKI
jgi:LacI family transcriptional regulator